MNLTIGLIAKMKHAIGFDIKEVKKGVFSYYRNHYADDFCEDLELAVNYGLATKRKSFTTYYSLTEKGLDTLSSILGCKIKSR